MEHESCGIPTARFFVPPVSISNLKDRRHTLLNLMERSDEELSRRQQCDMEKSSEM